MRANFRDDAVINCAFLTQVQWLRRGAHIDSIVAVPRQKLQLPFAACNELTSQVLIWVSADIEREQDGERLVARGGISR